MAITFPESLSRKDQYGCTPMHIAVSAFWTAQTRNDVSKFNRLLCALSLAHKIHSSALAMIDEKGNTVLHCVPRKFPTFSRMPFSVEDVQEMLSLFPESVFIQRNVGGKNVHDSFLHIWPRSRDVIDALFTRPS